MITKKSTKKKPYQTILLSLFSALLIFWVIGFLIFSNWKTNQRRKELTLRIEALNAEIDTLEKKKQELEASASQLGEEEYLEKVAREQLNLQKPGEEVVAILSPEGEEKKEETKEEKSLWQKILDPVRNFFGDL